MRSSLILLLLEQVVCPFDKPELNPQLWYSNLTLLGKRGMLYTYLNKIYNYELVILYQVRVLKTFF